MLAGIIVLSLFVIDINAQAVERLRETAPVWNRLPYDQVDLGTVYSILNVPYIDNLDFTSCQSDFLN